MSSESQARGAHVLFQGSAWGEKGDLARLCLSVLHVLCILSFVMISTSVEGGMLASRVQERGGHSGARVQLSLISQPLEWSLSSLHLCVETYAACTDAESLFIQSLSAEKANAAPNRTH